MTPAAYLALCQRDHRARPPLLRRRRAHHRRRRVRPADAAAARRRGRAPRLDRGVVADPPRRPRAASTASPRWCGRCRCCRSTTPTTRPSCARFHDRVVKGLGGDEPVLRRSSPRSTASASSSPTRAGELTLAATRGDGTIGEDVTANVRDHPRDPAAAARAARRDGARRDLHGQGRCFARLNAARVAAGEEPFKNPRNTAGRLDQAARSARGGAAADAGDPLRGGRRRALVAAVTWRR